MNQANPNLIYIFDKHISFHQQEMVRKNTRRITLLVHDAGKQGIDYLRNELLKKQK